MPSFQKKKWAYHVFFFYSVPHIFNKWYCMPFLMMCKAFILSENVAETTYSNIWYQKQITLFMVKDGNKELKWI